uniref:Uncharacterized protein n=1 Tax=Osugoroshi virus TaxID=2202814 RepID=A0A7R7T1W5_9VIRU|nr:hypothetical protein [Osugoroshi virus]
MEDAKRAIDLVGLEYPADIKATYDDLPTDYDELFRLREHLYYLYTIGTETGNDDLADYALFANLHVRYRLLAFQAALTPADAYYYHIYEQKLPLMKWRPFKHHGVSTTQPDELVQEVQFATEVPVYINTSYEKESATETSQENVIHLHQDIVQIHQDTEEQQIHAPIDVAPTLVAKDHKFERAYMEYHTRISSDLIIRSTNGRRINTFRIPLRSMRDFKIFAVSYYGYPTRIECCDSARFSRLFHYVTGRFSGYDDAGYYVSVTDHKINGCQPLLSLALRQMSMLWLRPPPSR